MRDLIAAASQAAKSLNSFKRLADQAREREDRIDLAPQELWEQKDQEVLDHLELAIREAGGETPLFDLSEAS